MVKLSNKKMKFKKNVKYYMKMGKQTYFSGSKPPQGPYSQQKQFFYDQITAGKREMEQINL